MKRSLAQVLFWLCPHCATVTATLRCCVNARDSCLGMTLDPQVASVTRNSDRYQYQHRAKYELARCSAYLTDTDTGFSKLVYSACVFAFKNVVMAATDQAI